ncbi:MAG TPA: FGGY-family carbohydrate kinase, partial [Verrucomicrobiae bacterium]|nr:FGGY-family carbohydrate kinase [Verrucomicrobiae bacterium]
WWLIDILGLPRSLFPPVGPSGTLLGKLKPELMQASGLPALDIIATCSHDTGAAVAAVPATGGSWAYLSSGTWSLMGVELTKPVITDASRDLNFTNEIGHGGTIRLLKNIIGLWLVQECRRHWVAAQGEQGFDYATLTELAAAAPPFVSLVDPNDPRFLAPDNMPLKIASFCRETGQPEPATPGAFIRCVLESLALLYRRTLGQIESLIGNRIERLHIVGGGSKNALLNQFTADALQIPVVTGPVEATAADNVLIQAITLGHLSSLADARDVVRNSFTTTTVQPRHDPAWAEAYERFQKLAR